MKRGKNWTLQSASFQNPSCCSLVNPRSCFESNSLRSRVLGGRSFQRLLSINAIARLIKLQKRDKWQKMRKLLWKWSACWTVWVSATRAQQGEVIQPGEEGQDGGRSRRPARCPARPAPSPWTAPPASYDLTTTDQRFHRIQGLFPTLFQKVFKWVP